MKTSHEHSAEGGVEVGGAAEVTTQAPETRFDPWPHPRRPGPPKRPTPYEEPALWYLVPPAARAIIGGAAVATLAGRARILPRELDGLSHRLAETVRSIVFDDRGTTVGAALAIPEIAFPRGVLREVLAKLSAAGDVVAELHRQRDAIDQQLARLAALEGGAR